MSARMQRWALIAYIACGVVVFGHATNNPAQDCNTRTTQVDIALCRSARNIAVGLFWPLYGSVVLWEKSQ